MGATMFMLLAAFAGLVRGYSGFGFAMILALGLLSARPPVEVIPVVLLLDLLCSASLWSRALREMHGRLMVRLAAGMWVAVPLGVLGLSWVSGEWLAPAIALLCLIGAVLVLRQPQALIVAAEPSLPAAFWAGLGSGLATALASAGGPPLMLYLLRCGLQPRVLRATAIVFFAASSATALLGMGVFGLLGTAHLHLAATLLLPALAGNLLGQWLQPRWQPFSLHRLVGVLLVALSALSLCNSLLKL